MSNTKEPRCSNVVREPWSSDVMRETCEILDRVRILALNSRIIIGRSKREHNYHELEGASHRLNIINDEIMYLMKDLKCKQLSDYGI